jgi:ABC-type branched-subunit amino acid transport system substrate-binding protein
LTSLIRRSLLSIAVLGLSALVAACASTRAVTTPGVSASTVTFGSHQPLTGPAAPGYSQISAASQAFFSYVNAQGGVYGRSIRLLTMNDAYNPTNTIQVVNQLVTNDNVFGMFDGVGTSTHQQVVRLLNNDLIPDLFVASGCPCWNNTGVNPYTYGWQPNAAIEGKILGSYITRHLLGQRVAILYQDDAAGQAGLAGLRDEVRSRDLVAQAAYRPGATTLSSQMRVFRAAKARVLVDFTLPAYTAIEQLTAFRLGYHPQLIVWSGGIDPSTVSGLLKTYSEGQVQGTGLIDGAITDTYLPPPADTTSPWVRLFMKIDAQYDSHAPFNSNVEYGMASAYTLVQALRAAGPNLTRRGLIKAINRRGASWRGPGLVPFRYSITDHRGYTGAQLAQVQEGRLVVFGSPLITSGRPGSRITPYRRGQPGPPASGIPRG